jgi:hypothetical protein
VLRTMTIKTLEAACLARNAVLFVDDDDELSCENVKIALVKCENSTGEM